MNFSMNATWSRGVELVRDNLQLLSVIAGVFLLLPTVAAYLLLPDFQILMDPSVSEEQTAAWIAENAGMLSVIGIFALVMNFAGYGAMVALTGGSRPTVGQAIGAGFRIVPSTIAALVLFAIAYMIGSIAIITPISLLASLGGAGGVAVLGMIAALVFVVWLMARLSLTLPVLALEDTLNPLKAMVRSFGLTRPRQWAVATFWVVLGVVYTIITLLVTGVFGVIAALAGTGTAASAIMGLANGILAMAVGMLISAIAVAMYGQLDAPSPERVEKTSE